MQIVIGVHHFPPRYNGGAEWRAYRTARALLQRGHQVRVVAVEKIDVGVGGKVHFSDEVFEGVNVRRLSFDLSKAPDRFRWEYDNPWIGDHLREFLSDVRPDLFHLIGGYLMSGSALRAAQSLGLPSVLTLTDFWFLCRRLSMLRSDGTLSSVPIDPARCARCIGEEQRRYRWMGQVMDTAMDVYWRIQKGSVSAFAARADYLLETLRNVDAIISPSRFLRQMFIESGLESERILFMRQGHDSHSHPSFAMVGPSPTVLRVGYLGQIADIKGVHVLLEAARSITSAALEVRVYGDPQTHPHYTRRLERIIAADSRLHMMGLYKRSDLSAVLASCDVIVVPSLWYENSPNVILEAFAHGVPVIASNVGGMAELVQDGVNGLHFQLGSVSDLSRQIERLLNGPLLLQTLREGAASSAPPTARARCKRFLSCTTL